MFTEPSFIIGAVVGALSMAYASSRVSTNVQDVAIEQPNVQDVAIEQPNIQVYGIGRTN